MRLEKIIIAACLTLCTTAVAAAVFSKSKPQYHATLVSPTPSHYVFISIPDTKDTLEIAPTSSLSNTPALPIYTPTPFPICPDDEELCILDVPPDKQDYNLSCEASVSGMAASYFVRDPPNNPATDKKYSSWEEYFVNAVPRNCDPHLGFSGDIGGMVSTVCNKEGYGYGVYAEPLAEAFRKTGIDAVVRYGINRDDIEAYIKSGHPVIVWTSHSDDPPACEMINNKKVCYVIGEHVWLVTGVRHSGKDRLFLIIDPKTGGDYWVWDFPRWNDFTNYDGIGRMSLIVGK
jgi:uncharacterized protein YvpB